MNELQIRQELFRLLLDETDVGLMNYFKSILKRKNATQEQEYDWADELSEQQIQSILQGKKDIEEGRTTPHEDVEKELDEFLKRKR